MSDHDYASDNGSDMDYSENMVNEYMIDESSIASTDVVRQRKRDILDRYKYVDNGYRQITAGYKRKKLEYYATSYIPGASIRNAITGARYDQGRVGDISEDLYFKVSYAADDSTGDVSTMFYDDPEQFERHMSTKLSDNSKQAWAKKYERAYATLSAIY
jgi:hypothetical protein